MVLRRNISIFSLVDRLGQGSDAATIAHRQHVRLPVDAPFRAGLPCLTPPNKQAAAAWGSDWAMPARQPLLLSRGVVAGCLLRWRRVACGLQKQRRCASALDWRKRCAATHALDAPAAYDTILLPHLLTTRHLPRRLFCCSLLPYAEPHL